MEPQRWHSLDQAGSLVDKTKTGLQLQGQGGLETKSGDVGRGPGPTWGAEDAKYKGLKTWVP